MFAQYVRTSCPLHNMLPKNSKTNTSYRCAVAWARGKKKNGCNDGTGLPSHLDQPWGAPALSQPPCVQSHPICTLLLSPNTPPKKPPPKQSPFYSWTTNSMWKNKFQPHVALNACLRSACDVVRAKTWRLRSKGGNLRLLFTPHSCLASWGGTTPSLCCEPRGYQVCLRGGAFKVEEDRVGIGGLGWILME